MRKITLVLLFISTFFFSYSQNLQTENIVLITLDGFRWQEVFNGADSLLLHNKKYVVDKDIKEEVWSSNSIERRKKLLPFFWNVIGENGQIYGNRQYGNKVNCANPYAFSYPGYSEILSGFVNYSMHSNNKIENQNYTVLEFINEQSDFKGKVASFSTWDVIPFIVGKSSSGIFTNCGREKINCDSIYDKNVSQNITLKSNGLRSDSTTFLQAQEYMKQKSPRLMFISLDETDEHGHSQRYDDYLKSAYQSDFMIGKLWEWIQTHEPYKNKTTMIVTTDHGRGKDNKWGDHGKLFSVSGQIWFAVIGPDTPAIGEVKVKQQLFQKQLAKTMAAFLGLDYKNKKKVGECVSSVLYKNVLIADK